MPKFVDLIFFCVKFLFYHLEMCDFFVPFFFLGGGAMVLDQLPFT